MVIRANKLVDVINGYFNEILEFKPECGICLIVEQYMVMKHYIEILQKRAEIENIDLTMIEVGPKDEDGEKGKNNKRFYVTKIVYLVATSVYTR